MASITFREPDFKLTWEMPWNNFCVIIRSKDGDDVTIMFRDADQWMAFRSTFEKCAGYRYSTDKDGDVIEDHHAADMAAADFYRTHKQTKAA